MKRFLAVLLVAAAVPAFASATVVSMKKAPQSKQTTAQTLTQIEEVWADALVKADLTALDAILADSYVETGEHGQRSNKSDILADLKSGVARFDSLKLSDMTVYPYGDAAVVVGTATGSGLMKGERFDDKVVFTDTFVKLHGKWRAVASHISAL
jgi:hypothetical protein